MTGGILGGSPIRNTKQAQVWHLSWQGDIHLDILDSVFALVDGDVPVKVGAAIEEPSPIAPGWQWQRDIPQLGTL